MSTDMINEIIFINHKVLLAVIIRTSSLHYYKFCMSPLLNKIEHFKIMRMNNWESQF